MMWSRAIFVFVLISVLGVCLIGCNGVGVSYPEPIYAPTKLISYYNNGDILSENDYEYDDAGNCLQTTSFHPATSHSDESTNVSSYEGYDEFGYYDTMTLGDNAVDVSWTIEQGRAVEKRYGNSEGSFAYEYDSSGRLISVTMSSGTYRDTITIDYDARTIKGETLGGVSPGTYEVVWNTDDKGNVVGYSIASDSDGESRAHSFTCQCDIDGNAVTVWDEDGYVYETYEYKHIDNPSNKAWIDAQIPAPIRIAE